MTSTGIRTRATAVLAAAAALTATLAAAPVHAAPRHPSPAHPCSPYAGIESFSDALDKTQFQSAFVGNFSGLAVDTRGRIAALSDRSQLFTLDPASLAPLAVTTLADEKGAELDSEGLAALYDGQFLVSSETEPSVRRYDRAGRITGRLPVPDALLVAPAGRAYPNATFEGLAVQPDGRTVVAAMEAPLSGDTVNRIQTWRDGRLAAQYGYQADPSLGISETTATGDGRLLVLERGFTAGVGNTVRLYLADLRRATDVRAVERLTGQPEVRLVRKTLLADLVDCPSLGATAKQPQPNPLLDNIEAMAVTGRTPDGGLRLLLASDDNQNPAQTTRFYRFVVKLPRA
ncbi:esterase-like activity of phytase family protein [Streptomyces sp. NPDC001941]|uniref:esterase-like activity of phytase family protein n=1 Tax=Streptomyces sp. NPDC001941 TaxID=3154659 RepID=UPI003331E7ED